MTELTSATPDPAASLSDWQIKHAEYERRNADLRLGNKTAVFDALAAAGVSIVVVTFDGYGDSGQIETIEAKGGDDVIDLPPGDVEIASAAWGAAEPKRTVMNLHDAIEWLTYDFLAETHGGWENNDGAYGDFTFDVAARTITLDYNERYTSSENYTHEF